MVLGFIFRAVYRYETSLGIYILQTLFILLAPIFFLWGLYRSIVRLPTCLQRDLAHLDTKGELGQALGEEVSRKCLLLKPHRIARIFVSVDIVTFWVQAGGGGLSVNADLAETGKWIALVGLIIQLIALSCFLIMTTTFGLRVCVSVLLALRARLMRLVQSLQLSLGVALQRQ